jgi:hypothetical protein
MARLAGIRGGRLLRGGAALLVLSCAAAAWPDRAEAVFRGENGRIVFSWLRLGAGDPGEEGPDSFWRRSTMLGATATSLLAADPTVITMEPTGRPTVAVSSM